MEDFCIHKYEPFYTIKYKHLSGDDFFAAVMLIVLTLGVALIPLMFFYFFGPYREKTYLGHHCKHCGIKQ